MDSHNENYALRLINQAKRFYSIPQIAKGLDVSPSTVSRWISGKSHPKPYVTDRLHNLIADHIRRDRTGASFRFVDLFAGIGGIRIGFEKAGGECVFTSEWDEYAKRTYNSNFPSEEEIAGDITAIDAQSVPDHDVLLAGFPCQPFSIAGVSKKNSLKLPHGFADKTQGTLFFDVVRIIAAKRPKLIVLENVKNLRSHDKGNTYTTIVRTLREDLGYTIDDRVFDGQHWVPQHRERIVIVGFRDPVLFSLDGLSLPEKGAVKLGAVLHRTDGNEPYLEHDGDKYFDHARQQVNEKYTLSDHLWKYLQDYADKHRSLGNGFGFGLVDEDSVTRTLSARYYKDGSEILVYQGKSKNPRRLTPRETARLMGFPDDFIIPVSDTRAYKQFGNSVVVPLFEHLAQYLRNFVVYQEQPDLIYGRS